MVREEDIYIYIEWFSNSVPSFFFSTCVLLAFHQRPTEFKGDTYVAIGMQMYNEHSIASPPPQSLPVFLSVCLSSQTVIKCVQMIWRKHRILPHPLLAILLPIATRCLQVLFFLALSLYLYSRSPLMKPPYHLFVTFKSAPFSLALVPILVQFRCKRQKKQTSGHRVACSSIRADDRRLEEGYQPGGRRRYQEKTCKKGPWTRHTGTATASQWKIPGDGDQDSTQRTGRNGAPPCVH